MKNKRIVFINGKFVKDEDALISINDLGFTNGDAVYDTFRTYGHKVFHLEEHLERLFSSVKYTNITTNFSKEKIKSIIKKILDHNLKLINKNDDFWCFVRFTRSETCIVDAIPFPFKNYSRYYKSGIRLITPSVRRIPEEFVSPRAKIASYINLSLARQEVWSHDRDANALLLDDNGNVNEGYGFNFFLYNGNDLITPLEKKVLPGIVRSKVISLSNKIGLNTHEKNIDLYDVYNAKEAFITSTSWGICPVQSVNGKKFSDITIPAEITKKIQALFSDMVGINIEDQYLYFNK